MHWVGWEIPKPISMGLIVVIFLAAFFYARRQGPRPADPGDADPPLLH
jgi:hypothetical protein